MAVQIASLNSGSNGNCYYIGTGTDAILVDAGLPLSKTTQRLTELGLNWGKIVAIIITHEHSDHISGLKTICKKNNIPVYGSKGTVRHIAQYIAPDCLKEIPIGKPIVVRGFTINAFSKSHDASDPISLSVQCEDATIGVFTDIGKPCAATHKHFQDCDAAFLEANYDDNLLANSPYPYFLKQRISGGRGHLSNTQAAEIFKKYRSPSLSLLILAHLSAENNSPELAVAQFVPHAGHTKVIAASRSGCSELFEIRVKARGKKVVPPTQLSLF